ncbi:MAG: alanine--tRNA ligase-related protein, partial [bacterium]
MTTWPSTEIRDRFLKYFESKGHQVAPGAPLVPDDDPTLLFINAGMAPLKKYFLGTAAPPAPRLASCQKCLRTSDIEKVGATPRHLTFFEMLGNFSFGDYFKEEAIAYAWELLTDNKVGYGMDPARLWITIFQDDNEAGKLWQKVAGVKADRIKACGAADNFWSMGDTGPCGPCSEVIYDLRESPGTQRKFPDEDSTPPEGVEIWNLVFTQFDKQKDGTLKPLPKKNVDTG